MKRALSHSPVAIKLGLRDLKNNPIATGVLIVILSIVLGYAVSLFVNERIAWTSSFLKDQQEVGMTFSALDASSPDPISPAFDLYANFSERPTSTEDYLDGSIPHGSEESDFALLNDVLEDAIETYPITATLNDEPTSVEQDGYSIDQSIVGLAADWSLAELSSLARIETGRKPMSDREIAIASGKSALYEPSVGWINNSSVLEEVSSLRLGDTITLTTGMNTETYTVVGTFTPTVRNLTGDVLFPQAIGELEKSQRPTKFADEWHLNNYSTYSEEAADAPQAILYFLAAGKISNTQAVDLFIPFTYATGDFRFGLRPLGENLSLALQASENRIEMASLDLTDFSQIQVLSGLGILTLVMVLSFPLYARNHRRRKNELHQLQRAGVAERSLALSRVVPSLFIGSVVSVFAIGMSAALLLRGNPHLGWLSVIHTRAYLDIFVLSVVGAFGVTLIPAVAASFYARLTANTPIEQIHSPGGTQTGLRPASPSKVQRWAFPVAGLSLIFAGFAVMVVSATTLGPGCRTSENECSYEPLVSQPLLGLSLGGVFLLIGAYLAIPSAIRTIERLTQHNSLPQRYAARELAARPIVTAHSVLPLALLMTIGVVFNLIAQQHDSEEPQYYDQWSYIFEVSISIAIPLCVVAILMLVYGGLLSREEIELSRAPLSRQGLNPHELRRIDMFRAIYVAGVSAALALILGTFTGVILMYYRAEYSQGDPVSVAAWLPSYPTLIAVILPLALSPLIGSLIGRRHARIAMQST